MNVDEKRAAEAREAVEACQAILGHRFDAPDILRRALTHASLKSDERRSNERLEFLGDAILGMVISERLYRLCPDATEGRLTQVKSVVVSSRTLSRVARALELHEHLLVGKGLANQERLPRSAQANLFEALVAAVYLDGGWTPARRFILDALGDEVDRALASERTRNFKSILQQYAQKEMGVTPTYRVVKEEGPDHSKRFEVVAVVGQGERETGRGSTKKAAEQEAAEATLKSLLGGEFAEGDLTP